MFHNVCIRSVRHESYREMPMRLTLLYDLKPNTESNCNSEKGTARNKFSENTNIMKNFEQLM